MRDILLKRYSIFSEGVETDPANVIERAVDLHALRIISSAPYQKCIQYLWKGWICQEEGNPTNFVEYSEKSNTGYWVISILTGCVLLCIRMSAKFCSP
jgi:hypothetical protein